LNACDPGFDGLDYEGIWRPVGDVELNPEKEAIKKVA